jgi:glucan endo-1,3-alpha-glucosidase
MQAYITAYKEGLSLPFITQERVVYWYRTTPKRVTCTNDTLGIPQGIDLLQDLVFVTTMLNSPAMLTVRSGGLGAVTINAPAGVTTFNVTMGVGAQVFAVSRNGVQIASGTGGLEIKTTCLIYSACSFLLEV